MTFMLRLLWVLIPVLGLIIGSGAWSSASAGYTAEAPPAAEEAPPAPPPQAASPPEALQAQPAAPWYPPWAPWVLWIIVIACITVVVAEFPKRRLVSRSEDWKTATKKAEKVRLLAPWLAGIGGVLGAGVFSSAPGIELPIPLAAVLGAGVGAVSFPIYDGVIKVLGFLPAFVKKRGGLDTIEVKAQPVPPSGEEAGAEPEDK